MKYFVLFLIIVLLRNLSFSQVDEEDRIKNPVAFQKYQEGQKASGQGLKGWETAGQLLNEADSLEPNNPLILSERGMFRMHSKTDIDGGVLDQKRAFELAKTTSLKENYANNLGLAYMELCDIESACEAWKYAGRSGNYYIRKYCTYRQGPKLEPNLDEKLMLTLELIDTVAFVTSRYNSPQMASCMAQLTIQNEDYSKIRVPGGTYNYGLKTHGMTLFLEAIDVEEKELVFFTETDYDYYNLYKDVLVLKGEQFSQEVNLTFVHQFWKPGIYKVRIGLKGDEKAFGFSGVYYTDWVDLIVQFDIQEEDYDEF